MMWPWQTVSPARMVYEGAFDALALMAVDVPRVVALFGVHG
jgi:hypothetical protein